MNAIVPQSFGALSTRFQGQAVENDLSAGVTSGYGMVGYKGKVWSIRYRGEDRALMRDDGDGPRSSIEVVILKSPTHLSKVFYENGYEEGSVAPPDCLSSNGVTPDATATKKQAETCALCPRNVFGTGRNGKGKACSDAKRLAIAPLNDIENEAFGGPMLLRVPAASLQDLAKFGDALKQMGYPYYGIGTRISFDPKESFPKFVFGAIRPLSDAEADKVITLRDSAIVGRILAEADQPQANAAAPQAKPTLQFEQPPAQPAPAPAPAPQVQSPPTQPVQPAPPVQQAAPQPVQTTPAPTAAPAPDQSAFEKTLDEKLNALLPV